MMIDLVKHLLVIKFTRRMLGCQPSQRSKYILLVQSDPILYLAVKPRKQRFCIMYIIIDDAGALSPLILIDKGLGQIPVVNGHHGLYVVFQALVNDILVKSYSLLVNLPGPLREDPGP